MGLSPRATIRFFNHFGLSEFLIFFIIQLPKIEQACFLSLSIFTLILCLKDFFILIDFNSFNFPMPLAARSLAIPLTPRQSGLLGVIESSIQLVSSFSNKNFLF